MFIPHVVQLIGIKNCRFRQQNAIHRNIRIAGLQTNLCLPYGFCQFRNSTGAWFTSFIQNHRAEGFCFFKDIFFAMSTRVNTNHNHVGVVTIQIHVIVSQEGRQAIQLSRIDSIVCRHSIQVFPDSSLCLSFKIINQSIYILHNQQNSITHKKQIIYKSPKTGAQE